MRKMLRYVAPVTLLGLTGVAAVASDTEDSAPAAPVAPAASTSSSSPSASRSAGSSARSSSRRRRLSPAQRRQLTHTGVDLAGLMALGVAVSGAGLGLRRRAGRAS